jgi:hypothetical protein
MRTRFIWAFLKLSLLYPLEGFFCWYEDVNLDFQIYMFK